MEDKEKIEKEQENAKKKVQKRLILIPLCILLGTLAIYLYWDASHYQSTDDAYIETHMVKIAPKVSGEVVEVYIDDNQQVKEGDLVVKIDDDQVGHVRN